MYNLILFGPPGSGKGTQSDNITKAFRLEHISTGDLLRQEVSDKTTLGLEAQKYMDQGALVPDEVVIGMISSKIDDTPQARGFIFDGFPRTTAQAEALDKLLELKNTRIHQLLSLEVPEEELKARMLNRALTSGRTDDNEEVIAKRIIEYKEKTAPVLNYYDQFGKVAAIDGIGSIEEIFSRIFKEIELFLEPA